MEKKMLDIEKELKEIKKKNNRNSIAIMVVSISMVLHALATLN